MAKKPSPVKTRVCENQITYHINKWNGTTTTWELSDMLGDASAACATAKRSAGIDRVPRCVVKHEVLAYYNPA